MHTKFVYVVCVVASTGTVIEELCTGNNGVCYFDASGKLQNVLRLQPKQLLGTHWKLLQRRMARI